MRLRNTFTKFFVYRKILGIYELAKYIHNFYFCMIILLQHGLQPEYQR